MKETKHTPGPWDVQDVFEGRIPIDAPQKSTGYDGATEICLVSAEDDERQGANARLIAAAPDMLAALEKCVSLLNRIQESEDGPLPMPWPEIQEAEAAISKARGTL